MFLHLAHCYHDHAVDIFPCKWRFRQRFGMKPLMYSQLAETKRVTDPVDEGSDSVTSQRLSR